MTYISWTCHKCERVQAPDEACGGCGAVFAPKPPYPFCRFREQCIANGHCMRTVDGEPWCCAD